MDTNVRTTAAGTQGGIPNPLGLPTSSTELYDSVMGAIDPELLSANIPTLGEFISHASLSEIKAKGKQYYASLQKCAEGLKGKKGEMEQQTVALFRFMQKTLEEMSTVSEAKMLERLEQSFSSAPPTT